MKILLTGSSGFIGGHILKALQHQGHDVVAVSRKNGFDFSQLTHVEDWIPHLKKIDVVINCVGIIVETRKQRFSELHHHAPAALFKASEQAGVQRIIQISALGADEYAYTPYQLSKRAADDVLRSLPMDWFILRPSLVYGPGGQSTAMFQAMSSLPIVPLIGGGIQRIQPVHVDDLVAAVLACFDSVPAQQTIDVVGPNELSFRDWLKRLRQLKKRGRFVTVSMPYPIMLAASHLLKFFAPLMHPDNLRMLQAGNLSSAHSLTKLLGREPRDVP
ncbi:MAG: complex I NDUFA9 subunit family protein [Gammaproteobacteria bacterium]|nr:complex I NDUFA9 subunit family protein [Gammaproteobacteria bacterium]MDH5693274.1 complex I NDUFA9 subunit family protein [Gammaproteobacteria bacterium]